MKNIEAVQEALFLEGFLLSTDFDTEITPINKMMKTLDWWQK